MGEQRENRMHNGRDLTGLDALPSSVPRPPEHPCHATTRNGNPCGNLAIPGGSVCRFHGGSSPVVKRKAALRLATLVDPAIAVLAREMTSTSNRPADRLRAAENVLDRSGFPRRTETTDPTSGQAILIERLREIRDSALAERDVPSSELVIVGEVIPAEPDPVTQQHDPPPTEELA